MGIRDLLFIGLVLGTSAVLGASLIRAGSVTERRRRAPADSRTVPWSEVIQRVDDAFRANWRAEGLVPARRGRRAGRYPPALAGNDARRFPRWRNSAASKPFRQARRSIAGSKTCFTIAASPIRSPSGSPAPTWGPRAAHSLFSAAGNS